MHQLAKVGGSRRQPATWKGQLDRFCPPHCNTATGYFDRLSSPESSHRIPEMAAQLQAAQSKGPAFTKIIYTAYTRIAMQFLRQKLQSVMFYLHKTFAEGAEHKEQVDFLRTAGCDKIQGYYYSKPVPLEEYVKMLEAQK